MKTDSTKGILSSALLAAICTMPSAGQTLKSLDAPVVKESIGVRWNGTDKMMQTSLDGGRYHNLPTDALYEAKGPIHLTYTQLNPLRIRATSSIKAVDDPTFAVLTEFFKAAQSVTDLVVPKPTNAAPELAGPPCTTPNTDLLALLNHVYYETANDGLPTYLKNETDAWTNAIDNGFKAGKKGWEAVDDGVTKVNATADAMAAKNKLAKDDWIKIFGCSTTAPNPALQADYLAARLSRTDLRIAQIDDIRNSVVKLGKALESGYVRNDKRQNLTEKWTGPKEQDYVIGAEIQATREKMQEVTVKLTSMTFSVAPITSALSLDSEDLGSATLTVQRWSPYVIEKSVGAVFGVLKQPSYGTATNADGKTIVARTTDKALSVNPAIMVNFVCRCAGGLPMLQIGAATSKDLPAFLAGGGIRLFGLGKGDFGLTYGAMIGWYKDLSKLQVGSVITGTKDIDSDLAFISKPHIKSYFAIQYKF